MEQNELRIHKMPKGPKCRTAPFFPEHFGQANLKIIKQISRQLKAGEKDGITRPAVELNIHRNKNEPQIHENTI